MIYHLKTPIRIGVKVRRTNQVNEFLFEANI